MQARTRDDLLTLTPDVYLRDGYRDAAGAVRPALLSDCATAAATQLLAAEASPQELALTLEGVRQLLPVQGVAGAAAACRSSLPKVVKKLGASSTEASSQRS